MTNRPVPVVGMSVEQAWQRAPGGSGTYIAELSRALVDADAARLVGITARHGADDSPDPDFAPTLHRLVGAALPRTALYEAWNRLGAPRAERIAGEPLDVVHATTWAVPATRRPLVVTVHDLAFLDNPDVFTRRGLSFFRRSLERVRREASRVVVPSTSTLEACLAAGLDGERLRLVPHGLRTSHPDPGRVEEFLASRGLARPYVFWCGTLEPRKNLRTLLAAFARTSRTLPDHDLVLAGPDGWGDLDLPADLGTARVHRLGRLSAEDLACAYSAADLFCFPSIAEGFGMPVLEAMGHGVPVVTSRGTPMEEIVGDAGIVVDPTDPAELADALAQAVRTRAELATEARRRAATYTWQAAAEATAAVYAELVGTPPPR